MTIHRLQAHFGKFYHAVARLLLVPALALAALAVPADAAPRKDFKVAWSIYTGYMPWDYAVKTGIVKKWSEKYGISINFVQFNDYVESVNQYAAGDFDAVADTSIDTLTIPAVGGVDSTILILGDYTNGNDAIFMKGKGKTLQNLKGAPVHLVQYSVSHYMLWLALKQAGMDPKDVKTSNIADADFVAAFQQPDIENVVVWNPATSQIKTMPNVSQVFDSSKLPGEIQDVLAVKTLVLKENPDFGKALVGAWYEALAILKADDAKSKEARAFMAAASGTTPEDFDGQVKTTYFYYDPAEAVAFFNSEKMLDIANKLQTFSFENNLLGNDVKDKGVIGIALPGGAVVGDAKNVKVRFDETFMKMAAEKKL
ncbi:putative urea ABC transporter substrate-binding protein [Xanthobacter agilis]|jgi:NitT/TauT family transport system substrate-binding protein|uniref:putative urea ABC transporter substrate-binding protein n=1 Tax=Xanthobacter agilis TaxID=47492 RepID=UPI003726810B